MLAALLSLTLLGVFLGALLGVANRFLAVEGDPLVEELAAMMPGSNCGQCGLAGCAAGAAAIAAGEAPPTLCPPGGKALAQALAARLGIALDLSTLVDSGPRLAIVAEDLCIGCCRCSRQCPTDAIVGAARQIHNVLGEACTACGNCLDVCPTEALTLQPVALTPATWVMPRPQFA